MERKLKILKAVLLLRRVNKYQTKEEQMAEAEKYYTDQELDEWIDWLKNPEEEPEMEFEPEIGNPFECFEAENRCPSCTAGDYSPSHPWDAPGMSIRDFI